MLGQPAIDREDLSCHIAHASPREPYGNRPDIFRHAGSFRDCEPNCPPVYLRGVRHIGLHRYGTTAGVADLLDGLIDLLLGTGGAMPWPRALSPRPF